MLPRGEGTGILFHDHVTREYASFIVNFHYYFLSFDMFEEVLKVLR